MKKLFFSFNIDRIQEGYNKGDISSFGVTQIILGWIFPFFLGIILFFSSFTIVKTSEVGIISRMGVITSEHPLTEGIHLKIPLLDNIERLSLKQHQDDSHITIQTTDFQELTIDYQVMYSIPAKFVINNKKTISGDVFEVVIKKRADESFRNVISHYQAIDVLQNRQKIITEIFDEVNRKLQGIAEVDNILLLKHTFSDGFQQKVNEKMVATQEAETAKVRRQKAQYEADANVIEAKGKAEAIKIESAALQNNPKIVELRKIEADVKIAEMMFSGSKESPSKWDGKLPQTIVNDGKSSVLLPIK